MRLGLSSSLVVSTLALFASGCTGSPEPNSSDGSSGTTAPADTDPAPSTGVDPTNGMTGSTDTGRVDTTAVDTTMGPPDTDTVATTDPTDTETSAGACQVWEITYDLEGSEFEIYGTPFMAGDQVNTLTMPYDADDTVGPGTIVLRFQDMGGTPGGLAAFTEYAMSMHFVVSTGGGTTVATDLEADAGPEECGVTTGELMGDTVAWMPSAIVGHHSMGQVLCNGFLCGAGGLPDGMPVAMDEVSDQPISDFVFTGDLSSFTMEQTVVQMDMNSTSAWTFAGTETGRELIDAPACLCG